MSRKQVSTQELISQECDKVKELLLAKNKAYGNSALEPVRIFSKASPEEALRVRIDDKLSRIAKGEVNPDFDQEDTVQDLIGYLVLLRIRDRMNASHIAFARR